MITRKCVSRSRDWVQPILTSNGTLGGSSFATAESQYYTEAAGQPQQAWRMFSNGAVDEWQINSVSTSSWYWAKFYNPTAIKVSKINVENSQGCFSVYQYELYGSNDNSNWTLITTGTNNNTADYSFWELPIPEESSGYYKYYKISVKPRSSTAIMINRLDVRATYKVVVEHPAETNLFVLNGGYDLNTCFGWNKDVNTKYTYVAAANLDAANKYHMAVMPCQPSTTYTINMYVQDWCRVGSHSIVPTANTPVNTCVYPAYQGTVGYNKNVTLQFTTGASDHFLFIFYWGETASSLSGDYLACYNTINIT